MPFDPMDFFILANDLVNDPNYSFRESVFRTSISRAHYSAFLICRTWLESEGFNFPPSADAHKLVITRLRKKKVYRKLHRKTRAVADVLRKLRKQGRNKADYNLQISLTDQDALKWIKDAEFVIQSIP